MDSKVIEYSALYQLPFQQMWPSLVLLCNLLLLFLFLLLSQFHGKCFEESWKVLYTSVDPRSKTRRRAHSHMLFARNALLKKKFHDVPFGSSPLVLSWTIDNIAETTFCCKKKKVEMNFCIELWEPLRVHQDFCECPMGPYSVGDHLRAMESRRATIKKKGKSWKEVTL